MLVTTSSLILLHKFLMVIFCKVYASHMFPLSSHSCYILLHSLQFCSCAHKLLLCVDYSKSLVFAVWLPTVWAFGMPMLANSWDPDFFFGESATLAWNQTQSHIHINHRYLHTIYRHWPKYYAGIFCEFLILFHTASAPFYIVHKYFEVQLRHQFDQESVGHVLQNYTVKLV
jgi:hypothetical protein